MEKENGLDKLFIEDLRDALADPDLAGVDNPRPYDYATLMAASGLARALGQCIVSDIRLPDDLAGTLPLTEAIAACDAIIASMPNHLRDIDNLVEDIEQEEEEVQDAMCCDFIILIHTLWLVELAISQAYRRMRDEGTDNLDTFSEVYLRALSLCSTFGDKLREEKNIRVIGPRVSKFQLLSNLRATLRGKFKETLPWWLDGTLEQQKEENYGRN